MVYYSLSKDGDLYSIYRQARRGLSRCLDTGCSLPLLDRGWLKKTSPEAEIRTMATPITVRGIGENRNDAEQYVILPMFFTGKILGTQDVATAEFTREVHLVDDLQAQGAHWHGYYRTRKD